MKIHKKLVDLIASEKYTGMREILPMLGFKVKNNSIINIYQKEIELDSIFFTLEKLQKENLIEFDKFEDKPFDFPITSKFGDLEGPELANFGKLEFFNKYIKRYSGKYIFINPLLYSFINNGYRTEREKDAHKTFQLTIISIILSAFLTSFLTAYFTYYFSNSNEHHFREEIKWYK